MTKEEFQELLRRYKAGNCSEEEIQSIDNWFASIADKNLELSEREKVQMNKRMIAAIRKNLPSSGKQRELKRFIFPIWKVAASLVIITVVTFYFWINRTSVAPVHQFATNQSSGNFIEHNNATKESLTIHLPDSSTVKLEPDAEISYPKKWNDQKREVSLSGEAFFEVVKESERPFYVYGGGIVTKVLGTSFTVNAPKGAESVEVSVHTGKVSVYKSGKKDNTQQSAHATSIVLTPNEKVEYFVNDKQWVTSLVEKPMPLPTSNKSLEFVFSNTPMADIISIIERTYSIDIIIENEASYSCAFTGDVSMMELYDILKVICKSTGTNYEVIGTKILITGKGCL